MAQEKLLVCDALDERDLLRKRINQAIQSLRLVTVKRKKDEHVVGYKTAEEFSKEAESNYQSVKDLIDRYRRLDTAITLANAQTTVKTSSGKEMSRAEAISLRKNLLDTGSTSTDFTGRLLDVMKRQWDSAKVEYANINMQADKQIESMSLAALGKDGSKKDTKEVVDVIGKAFEGSYAELVNPIKLEEEYEKLYLEHSTLVKELETAIKVSNATTYVEF